MLALISHVFLGGHTDGYPGNIPVVTLLVGFSRTLLYPQAITAHGLDLEAGLSPKSESKK